MVKMSELEKQILKQEYPQLSFSEDLDIERYFELRESGFLREAIILYNSKLKLKYPDEKMRVELMSSFRKHSPRFEELLSESLIQLARKTIIQIKNIIEFITARIAKLDTKDVYSVIQKCEQVVSAISNDRFASISFTQKFSRYAIILNFKPEEMKKSAELIRLYVTDTLSSVNEYKAEQEAIAHKQKLARSYAPAKTFDFSKIVFTKEQEAAIIIPASINRIEDKVVAYTLKYWNAYSNQAFENAILLYSRKYKTRHFNIFQAVKIGRYRNWRDDEILQAVLLNVVTGYYYSISGDLYLQRQWAKARSTLIPEKKALPAPSEDENSKITKVKNNNTKTTLSTPKKTSTTKKKKAAIKTNLTSSQKKSLDRKKIILKTSETKNITSVKSNHFVSDEIKANGSISEIIKIKTGAHYKIHKGIFFDNILISIRKELDKYIVNNELSTNIDFNDAYIEAENLIYEFFEKNYENPFQNWQKSEHFEKIKQFGFNIISLDPIIDDWIDT